MAVNLDRNVDNNAVNVRVQRPDDVVDDTVVLDFTAHYDNEFFTSSVQMQQDGAWLTGTVNNNQFPRRTGNYDLVLNVTEETFLSLSQITLTLRQITSSLRNLRGQARADELARVLAYVRGNTFPNETEYKSAAEGTTEYKSEAGNELEYKSNASNRTITTYVE